jgi:hypothetical protein
LRAQRDLGLDIPEPAIEAYEAVKGNWTSLQFKEREGRYAALT